MIRNVHIVAATFIFLMGSVFFLVLRNNDWGFVVLFFVGPLWLLYALISGLIHIVHGSRKAVLPVGSGQGNISAVTLFMLLATLPLCFFIYWIQLSDYFRGCFSSGPNGLHPNMCVFEPLIFMIEIFLGMIVLWGLARLIRRR
ncbi:MAG: hypothetical protein KBD06_04735 [Candidatus Pacebacteria bacterium]|nr:hypothetical protein [Candidatus Paceibacterota bacterium]